MLDDIVMCLEGDIKINIAELPSLDISHMEAEKHFMTGVESNNIANNDRSLHELALSEFDLALLYDLREKSYSYLPKALIAKGVTLLNLRRIQDAEAIFAKVMDRDYGAPRPLDPDLVKQLRANRRKQFRENGLKGVTNWGQLENALAPYKEYLKIDAHGRPKKDVICPAEEDYANLQAVYYLSMIDTVRGRHGAAESRILEYLASSEIAPESIHLLELLGVAQVLGGKTTDAEHTFEEIFQLKVHRGIRNADHIIDLSAIDNYQLRLPELLYSSFGTEETANLNQFISGIKVRKTGSYFRTALNQILSKGDISAGLLTHLYLHRKMPDNLWRDNFAHKIAGPGVETILPELVRLYEVKVANPMSAASYDSRLNDYVNLASLYELAISLVDRVSTEDDNRKLEERKYLQSQLANTWQTVQHIIQDNFLHLLGVSKRESGCKNPVIRKTEFYLKLSPHEGSDSDEVLPAVEYIADLGHLKARISADLQSAGTKMEKPFLWTINPRIREYMMANYINDRLDLVESATLDKIRKFEPLGVVRVDLSAYLSDPASRRLICDYLQIDNDMISKVKDLHVHILMTKKVDFPESLFAEQAMLAGETIDLQEPLSLNDYVAVHSTSENYRVLTDLAEILGSTQGIMPSIISQPGWDLRSKAESQKEYLGISGLETAAFSRSLDTVVDAVESVGGQVPQTHTAKQAWVFFRNLHPLNIRICETDMFPDYIRTYDTEDRGPTPIMLETADLLEYTGAIPNDESGDAMRDHLLQVQITAYNTAADIANKDLLDRRNQPAEGIKKTYKEISRILCQSFNGDRTRAQKEVMLENLGTLVSTVCANYHGNIDGYLAELYQQASKSGFTRAKHGIAIYCLDTMQKVLSEDNLKPIIDIDSTQLRLGRENAVIYRALTFYSFLEQQKIECQTNPELYSEPVQDFAKSQQTWITNGLRAIHRLKIGHANHYAAHKADYDLMEGIFMRLRCNT